MVITLFFIGAVLFIAFVVSLTHPALQYVFWMALLLACLWGMKWWIFPEYR